MDLPSRGVLEGLRARSYQPDPLYPWDPVENQQCCMYCKVVWNTFESFEAGEIASFSERKLSVIPRPYLCSFRSLLPFCSCGSDVALGRQRNVRGEK